jgi:hypothetical protein
MIIGSYRLLAALHSFGDPSTSEIKVTPNAVKRQVSEVVREMAIPLPLVPIGASAAPAIPEGGYGSRNRTRVSSSKARTDCQGLRAAEPRSNL